MESNITFEQAYQELLHEILMTGSIRNTRTGETQVLFNKELTANLLFNKFPLITGRKMFWKNVQGEAEWMLSGSSNIAKLHEYDVHIWDQWADSKGELGPTYSVQLAKQWSYAIKAIATNYASRRAIISLWNYEDLPIISLPPCYHSLQFYCRQEGLLSLKVSSRSSDAAVGLPYDMAVCAYLLITAATALNYEADQVVFSLTDVHVNKENQKAVLSYLGRQLYSEPKFKVHRSTVLLETYESGPHIPMIIKP